MSTENRLQEIIDKNSNIVFFGGAGVSTESGISDFRSKNGLYNTPDVKFELYSPEYLLSYDCLESIPKTFFEFCRQKLDTRGIEPNKAHYKLAELEKIGKLKALITQNIDGLHQKAGSKNVIEIHGNVSRNYCMYCGENMPDWYIFDIIDSVPMCKECGKGVVRPEVTLYGEMLPRDAFDKAIAAICNADCLIVGGTSLVVSPAKDMVQWFRGKDLVIINNQETYLNRRASLVIRENIGEVLGSIILK